MFDDILPSEADASSDAILAKAESTIEADILPGMNNNNNFSIMIGTPYSKKDSVYRRVELGTWLPIVFPRANGFPVDKDKFVSVWPDRHSWKNCSRDYNRALKSKEVGDNGPIRKLNQEHYLRISSSEDRLLSDSFLQEYSRFDLEKNIGSYNIYITTDLTSSEDDGCYSGIIAWAVNDNMDWFLLDINLRQMGIEDQYTTIFRMVKYYKAATGKAPTVGIEVDGNQRAHIVAIKERMVRLSEFFPIGRQKGSKFGSEGILTRLEGGSKHWRLRMMLPMFQNRKMWFPRELQTNTDFMELMSELKGATYAGFTSKFVDGVDCVSQINMLDVNYPSPTNFKSEKTSVVPGSEDELWDRIWKNKQKSVNAYSSYV